MPYTGPAEFQFSLWAADTNGSQLGSTLTVSPVGVTNGLFTVTLDFGNQFPGENRWLELAARTNLLGYTTLSPRQPLSATPYAITAGNLTGTLLASQLSGTVPSANLSGTYSEAVTFNNAANSYIGDGSGLTSLDASQLSSGTIPVAVLGNAWKTGGNAGTTPGTHFVGTTDNQPLEFKVNGLRALRLEDNGDSPSNPDDIPDGAPNTIAGSSANLVGSGVVGATISGGGATNYQGTGNLRPNTVHSDFGTIGGGLENRITPAAQFATIAGGYTNSIYNGALYGTIAGGQRKVIGLNATNSVIGGGEGNTIWDDAYSSTIGGGASNGIYAGALLSTIMGGRDNRIGLNANRSAIGGGESNTIWDNAWSSTIAGGAGNAIGNRTLYSAIGGGRYNNIAADSSLSTIAGGLHNDIGNDANYIAIGGGYNNNIADHSWYASIAGGNGNNIGNADFSAIGGGQYNNIADGAIYSTIPGGGLNSIGPDAHFAFAAGYRAKANHDGSFIWADSKEFDFPSNGPDKVRFRSTGGFDIVTGIDNTGEATTAAYLLPNENTWRTWSDRNAKKNFQPVDTVEVLEKLAVIPITRWNCKWDPDDAVPHLGPMAQDFKAAFFPGRDDKSISTLEFDGVALAAIQGLNQKLEDKLGQKETEIAQLKHELEMLKQVVDNLTNANH